MTSIYIPPGYWTALSAARADAASLRAELTCLRNAYHDLAQARPAGIIQPAGLSTGLPYRGTLLDIAC